MKTQRPLLTLLATAALFGSALTAHADVIGLYDFTAANVNSTDTEVNSVASSILNGAGLISTNAGRSTSNGGQFFIRTLGTSASEAAVTANDINGNDYVQFTLTGNSGFNLNLTNLTFNYGSYGGTVTYIQNFFVRSSLDGFTANISPGIITENAPATALVTTPNTATFDLSGAPFQSISAVTLRLYAFDDIDSNTSLVRMDNFTFNGTVTSAIPEPSTYALILGGLSALVVASRRSRAKRAA
jgi:hypothetical protein